MKPIDRKSFVRGGVLCGLFGLCAVLASREDKVECRDQCGKCEKFENGKCGLGLK